MRPADCAPTSAYTLRYANPTRRSAPEIGRTTHGRHVYEREQPTHMPTLTGISPGRRLYSQRIRSAACAPSVAYTALISLQEIPQKQVEENGYCASIGKIERRARGPSRYPF